MHPNHLDKLNIRRRAGSTDDINARWHTLTGLCFLMQFSASCATRGRMVLLRSTKIEDSGNRLRAPALRCGKQHHAAGLGQAIFGIHHADFRLLGPGNIFATTRGSQTTALHSCCKRSVMPAPPAGCRRSAPPAADPILRTGAVPRLRPGPRWSVRRASITSLANWINAEQRCSGLSSVRRSLA